MKTTFNGSLPSLQEPSLGKSPWLCLQCFQRAVVLWMLQLHCSLILWSSVACGGWGHPEKGCLMLTMWYHQKAVWDVWQGIQLHRHSHPYALPVPSATSDVAGPVQSGIRETSACFPLLQSYFIVNTSFFFCCSHSQAHRETELLWVKLEALLQISN